MIEAQIRLGYSNAFQVTIGTNRMAVLPRRFGSDFLKEIQSDGFKQLVTEAKANKGRADLVPAFRCAACLEDFWLTIAFFALFESKEDDLFRRFERFVRFYIDSRMDGHTTNYVYAAINQAKNDEHRPVNVSIQRSQSYVEIPDGWLRRISDTQWLLVDGKLAWVYNVFGFSERRDALEYDPRFTNFFRIAKQELSQNNASGQISTASDYNVRLKRILKEQHGIDWTTPEELKKFEQ